jgi:hypothetical protein
MAVLAKRRRRATIEARLLGMVGAACFLHTVGCREESDGADKRPNSAQASCVMDSDCLAEEFCDRHVCAKVGDVRYGVECAGPPFIGHLGIPLTILDECSSLMCLDGRCRSCLSAKECYDSVGHHACYPENEFGNRCGSAPPSGYEFYEPQDLHVRVGRDVPPLDGECRASTVTLSLSQRPVQTTSPVRLAVVWWHQRAGEFDEYARVGYDVALPDSDALEIPMADVRLQAYENLVCWRECVDRATCSCFTEPQIALGSIVLSLDEDRSGALSLEELRREQIGVADVFLGWSPMRTVSVPIRWGGVAGPIEAGLCLYPANADLRAVAESDTMFSLNTCGQGDAGCDLPVRRKFCHIDCDRDWGLNRIGL